MSGLGPFALAFVAGIVSFTSPCCLPLMPGYVSYVGGVSVEGGESTLVVDRRRTVAAACLFVLGFALVFTLLGAGASVFGEALFRDHSILLRVAGGFVILMGLAVAGVIRVPILSREVRLDLHRIRPGPVGAVPLGAAFAIGWTPCIGPVLAGILTAAASVHGALRGASLLFIYSLGLGVPFVLLAYGYSGTGRVFVWLRRHSRVIEIV